MTDKKVEHEEKNPWKEFFNWDKAAETFFLTEIVGGMLITLQYFFQPKVSPFMGYSCSISNFL